MHNLISHNQLEGSKQYMYAVGTQTDVIDEYYECLIECDDSASICKRRCADMLR